MSELTEEQFGQLPDFVKTEYQQVDGVYKHGATLKLKQSLNDLDTKYKGVESQLSETKGQLTQFQEQQSKAIEEAKAKAMEEARTNGDVKAIEERYQQQMEDLRKRVETETRESVTLEFQQKANAQSAEKIAQEIGLANGIDSDAGTAITNLISSRVKVENGQTIFHDNKGSALSVDKSGFIAELAKEPMFKRLLKAEITTAGGGDVSGAGKPNGSTTGQVNQKAEDAKKKGDPIGFLNHKIQENLSN